MQVVPSSTGSPDQDQDRDPAVAPGCRVIGFRVDLSELLKRGVGLKLILGVPYR